MMKTTPQPGDVLAGRFKVERVLGEGAMGQVLLVQHLLMRQHVAMKIVQPGRAGHGDYLSRFFREAEAAARLKTEHVTRVFDVGYLEDGAPYMVMELLAGKDLSVVLRERSPAPLPISDA